MLRSRSVLRIDVFRSPFRSIFSFVVVVGAGAEPGDVFDAFAGEDGFGWMVAIVEGEGDGAIVWDFPFVAFGVSVGEGKDGGAVVESAGSTPPWGLIATGNAKGRPADAGGFDIDEKKSGFGTKDMGGGG